MRVTYGPTNKSDGNQILTFFVNKISVTVLMAHFRFTSISGGNLYKVYNHKSGKNTENDGGLATTCLFFLWSDFVSNSMVLVPLIYFFMNLV